MRTARAAAALLVLGLAACTGSSNGSSSLNGSSSSNGTSSSNGSSSTASAPTAATSSSVSPPRGCPTTKAAIAELLGENVERAEGATSTSTAQVCAFGTSTTDLGALSVAYLRFPRVDLKARTLAQARDLYGSTLAGHTVIDMPSWGADAFLDESVLPDRNVTAEFAWVPGFEIILGMHSDDRHVAQRRELIDRLVAFAGG